jgi:hypothetical protein
MEAVSRGLCEKEILEIFCHEKSWSFWVNTAQKGTFALPDRSSNYRNEELSSRR